MSLQTDKIRLAKMILSVENKSIIQQIKDVLNATKSDWWDEISTEEKSAIKEGLSDLNKGKKISHENVMKKYKKWL